MLPLSSSLWPPQYPHIPVAFDPLTDHAVDLSDFQASAPAWR